jgi:heat shock protein HslJ
VKRALLMCAALALCACSAQKATAPEATLPEAARPEAARPEAEPRAEPQPRSLIVWNLASVNGAPMTNGHLELGQDGRSILVARGPCNSLSGVFAEQGPDVLFSPGVVTQVLCSRDRDAEGAYFDAVSAARRMESDGELMVLKDADGKEIATSTRAKPAAPALSSPPSAP